MGWKSRTASAVSSAAARAVRCVSAPRAAPLRLPTCSLLPVYARLVKRAPSPLSTPKSPMRAQLCCKALAADCWPYRTNIPHRLPLALAVTERVSATLQFGSSTQARRRGGPRHPASVWWGAPTSITVPLVPPRLSKALKAGIGSMRRARYGYKKSQ
jgi:hypothetical protein